MAEATIVSFRGGPEDGAKQPLENSEISPDFLRVRHEGMQREYWYQVHWEKIHDGTYGGEPCAYILATAMKGPPGAILKLFKNPVIFGVEIAECTCLECHQINHIVHGTGRQVRLPRAINNRLKGGLIDE